MKKQAMLLTGLATLTLSASLAFAWSQGTNTWTDAKGGIVGSKHDMTVITNINPNAGEAQGRVCAFCHTPHHKISDDSANILDYNPLWSHQISQKRYTPYVSTTFSKGLVTTDVLAGPSRLCMSCHDGVIAADQHYGSSNADGASKGGVLASDAFNGGLGIGLNVINNTHPIGFSLNNIWTEYPAIRQNLNAPHNNTFNTKPITDLGFGDSKIMTCASCHEVHNRDNAENVAFLYEKQVGSAICLMCHDK